MKLRAIFCCFYFGIVPWWIYQKKCHYGRGYWNHLKLNFQQIKIWITDKYTKEDIDFEKEVNPSWSNVMRNMCRFTYNGNFN